MDVQPATASGRTPLGDLEQLIANGVNPTTLEKCHGLASLFLDKREICDKVRSGVLSIVLQEILNNVIFEQRQQALDLLADLSREKASKTAAFQVSAAAELLGLTDETAFEKVDEHRTSQLEASWTELKENDHNRGPTRERQLRAAIWLGDKSSRTGLRKKNELLMTLETAIRVYLADQAVRDSFRARVLGDTARAEKNLSVAESPDEKFLATSQSTTTTTGNVRSPELSVTDPDLYRVTDKLAGIVRRQWQEEQRRRKENDPFLLPLRWKNSPGRYTAHWATIRGILENNQEIALDGTIDGIVKTFRSVPSNRLVVLGQGGAGKTTLVIELLLKLLDPAQRSPGDPVPVILNLASWNPYQQSLSDWITERLIADYQDLDEIIKQHEKLFGHFAYADHVLPILDGFDEIDPDLHTSAIQALNVYTGKMVMTSRTQEYYDAIDSGDVVLSRAAVIVLEDLTLHEISCYLPLTTRPLSNKTHSPTKWDPVLSHIQSNPNDAQSATLLEVFATPLMVSLARRIYSDTVADPIELLDRNRVSSATTLSDYLLDQFIHVTYNHLPQERSIKQYGAWQADEAQYRLACFALYLHSLGVRGLSQFSGAMKKTRSIKVPFPWSMTKLSQKVYRRLALLKIESKRLDGAYFSLPSKKFLEDACRRGVLRRSGANYEFRHVLLQDRLAYKILIGDKRVGKLDFEDNVTKNLIIVLLRCERFAEVENLSKIRMGLLLNPPWRRGRLFKRLPAELSIKRTDGCVLWSMHVAGGRHSICYVRVPRSAVDTL